MQIEPITRQNDKEEIMKERTKRLQALFCALAVTATSVGSPLLSVPVYAEETQGTEDTSEQPETESGKTTDTSDNAISESPDQAEKSVELIPVFPKQKDIKKQPMFTCLQTKEYCY